MSTTYDAGDFMSIVPDSSSPQLVAKPRLGVVGTGSLEDWEPGLAATTKTIVTGDARETGLPDDSVDLVVTSPPYWQKRDYGHQDQIGQELTPQGYVAALMDCFEEWRRVMRSGRHQDEGVAAGDSDVAAAACSVVGVARPVVGAVGVHPPRWAADCGGRRHRCVAGDQ